MKGRLGLWTWATVCLLAGCRDSGGPSTARGRLEAHPSSLQFQSVAVYDGRVHDVTLENFGKATVEIQQVWAEGPERTYRVVTDHDAEGFHLLGLNDQCQVKVIFTPRDAVQSTGVLWVRSDSVGRELLEIPLQGDALDAKASVSATAVDFGRIEVEMEKTLSVSFSNPSPLPVKVQVAPMGADRDEFTGSGSFELLPGEVRSLDVLFAPTRVGVKRAALDVVPCLGCPSVPVSLRAVGLDQAVVAIPPWINLGPVPVDKDVRTQVLLKNISTEPMTLTGFALSPGSDLSFSHQNASFPFVLLPNATVEYPVHYSPGHLGRAEAEALTAVVSPRNPLTRATLVANGGAPELCVSPLQHDFGNPPVGSKLRIPVVVKNCGASGTPVVVENAYLGSGGSPQPGEEQFGLRWPGQAKTLQAGDELVLTVLYEPTVASPAAATLTLETSLVGSERVYVALAGEARALPPCQLVVTPTAVDFGTVPPGKGAVLGIKLFNQGTDLCAVKNIRVHDSAGGVFFLPGGELDGHLVDAGSGFSFQVAAGVPKAGGSFVGAVEVGVADPAQPQVLVPLKVHSQPSCLVASPPYLDFGFARPDCPPRPAQVTLENGCAAPVAVDGFRIGAGTTDGEFVFSSIPVTPLTLVPGGTTSVEVRYLAQVGGMNLSPLFVAGAGLAEPLLVPLLGESHTDGDQVERFVQQDGTQVDVLFVVDNTGSMVEEQPRLVAALPGFIDSARQRGVDLQVAVTTTGIEPVSAACPGGAQGGEAGRLFPADRSRPRILTLQSPDVVGTLQANVQVGSCASKEQGLEAVRRALSPPLVDGPDDPRTALPQDGNQGLLREAAALAVVFVSDEDDHSADPVESYVRFLESVKGLNQPQRVVVYAIAPDGAACSTAGGAGTRYAEAARRTGGQVLSVCAPDYGASLRALAQTAFAPQERFPLADPAVASSVRVWVDGNEQTSGWSFDSAKNAVIFRTKPVSGAHLEIRYRKACP